MTLLTENICLRFAFFIFIAIWSVQSFAKTKLGSSESTRKISCRAVLAKLEDPNTLFQVVAIPSLRNGKFIGYEVKYLVDDLFPLELDLQVGDVVTSIQGKTMSSFSVAQSVFFEFQNKPKTVKTELLRKGRVLSQHYTCQW